ncbi:MAG: tRNA G10 N-methylase Trm11 [Candidatus Saccharimonadales bacterium]|jgi:tRNA G10  N-methylase Trm11
MDNSEVKTLAILGRQPQLGLAEIESLYGASNVARYGKNTCAINIPSGDIDFNRLGGVVRIAKILTELPSTKWSDIEDYLLETTPDKAQSIDGKLSFGISVYGLPVNARQVARTALLMKKAIKAAGNSVRMVPHNDTELGSAQVLYNKLTAKNGWELLVVSDGKTAYLAQTVRIQDIDAYSARDRERPMRDAKVGMLPPKLAQIIVNLAVGQIDRLEIGERRLEKDGSSSICILDPFCGTGVLLQEATLMDYHVYGTDIEPRMIQYSIDNLTWLDAKYPEVGDYRRVEVGNATRHTWDFSKVLDVKAKVFVAAETFLGQPLTTLPNGEHLSKIIYDVNLLHHKFLQNIAKQVPSGTRLCLAIPTWRGKHEFLHLPTLDYLEDLGYTRMSFKHVSNEDLIYHRDGQVVGRELLVIIKN